MTKYTNYTKEQREMIASYLRKILKDNHINFGSSDELAISKTLQTEIRKKIIELESIRFGEISTKVGTKFIWKGMPLAIGLYPSEDSHFIIRLDNYHIFRQGYLVIDEDTIIEMIYD